jgi:NAD(P)H-hydrate epimerase
MVTDLPLQLHTVDQVRAMDRHVIDVIGIPGIELMHRAGQCAFAQLLQVWPDVLCISVFCGAGNNGGDGYVIAGLALEHGLKVNLLALEDIDVLQADALTTARDFLQAGGIISKFGEHDWQDCDVVVDCLLGTGLSRDVDGAYKSMIEAINASQLPVLAVDIPSGLHADSGRVLGVAVQADQTATFIGLKQGLLTGQAADYCGKIQYYSLDVPEPVLQLEPPSAQRFVPPSPLLAARKLSAHKGGFGHVLLIGGESGFSGAICLAAQAAARCGAGLISVATRQAHAALLTIAQPEIMAHGVESIEQLLPLLNKATVVVIGPGLGQSAWAKQLLETVMQSGLPTVIDADALNLLALNSLGRLDQCVLTPHPGEAARLLQNSSQTIQNDRFAAIKQLYQDYGCTVLLKGAGTLVYDGQLITVNTTGNPGMASGGMGDVLSGVIAGLIAQGEDLASATRNAVWVHGEAADRAGHAGQRGLLASDLFAHIRRLVNQ